ncbi:ABC transporter substrate-binding protein [Methanocorpusculum sp. MG]|uniref:ABC transporter substrate-binding protein n=1 Tax=Methanocorpusculum petauri TaxID=3002863 RepID=A0ABT4IFU3_9EURY|nr:ABC transporter substrate-binding protein [Methanocorpusculum petauri]MCZ0860127.1 ABC transporter substrate-binding protein [Methanocorpusculum petauri]MDE2442790.1 ABC transporter substrate-binding protein [Methanocorpusculum sp.]
MKKYGVCGILCLCLVAAVVIAGCVGTPPAENKTLIVGIGENFPPYGYPEENGTYTGFDVESMRWIADRNGLDVSFKPLPWQDIVKNVADGTVDIVYCGLTITPERAEIVDFSNSYMTVNTAIAVRPDSSFTEKDVLSGNVSIATQSGGTSHLWIEKNLNETGILAAGNLRPQPTIEDAFSMLAAGTCDAVIYDDITVNAYVAKGVAKKIGTIETNEQYGVAVRKGDTATMQLINNGIVDLKASPAWQELLGKYAITLS